MSLFEGNKRWQSTRMMLIEQRDALEERINTHTNHPPQLDEQWFNEIAQTISDAYKHKITVDVTYFNRTGEHQISGQITKTNQEKIYIQGKEEQVWLDFKSISDVSLIGLEL